jgi:transcriptional regulator with XRE-family HTH domain
MAMKGRRPKSAEEAEFNAQYIARVGRLREASGLSQAQMAGALGLPLETYKKYETRTPLPIYLISRFALIARADLAHVIEKYLTEEIGMSDVIAKHIASLDAQIVEAENHVSGSEGDASKAAAFVNHLKEIRAIAMRFAEEG